MPDVLDRLDTVLARLRTAATEWSAVAAGELATVFATNRTAVAHWPRSYLSPGFTFGPAAPGARPAVVTVVSAELCASARAVLSDVPGTDSATYEDTPATCHRFDHERHALAYRHRPGVTFVDARRDEVVHVTSDVDDARFEAARLIREVIRRDGEAGGEVTLHAGSVVFGGTAWVVSGGKGAGKTTTVCALAEFAGADFIANDRVHIAADGAGFRVRAWPMSIRIGIGTCLASPGLRPWLRPSAPPVYPQTGWDPARGITDDEARALAATGGGPKIELVGDELTASLGVRAAAAGPIGGILLPVRRSRLGVPVVRRVSPDEAAARLAAESFTPDDDAYPDWLSRRRRSSDALRSAAGELVRAAVTALPVHELEFSTGRQAADAFRDLVRRPCGSNTS